MRQKAMPAGRQGFIYVLPLLALLLIVTAGSFYYLNKKGTPVTTLTPPASLASNQTEGMPCGGTAGEAEYLVCAEGLRCEYPEFAQPKTQGKCVSNSKPKSSLVENYTLYLGKRDDKYALFLQLDEDTRSLQLDNGQGLSPSDFLKLNDVKKISPQLSPLTSYFVNFKFDDKYNMLYVSTTQAASESDKKQSYYSGGNFVYAFDLNNNTKKLVWKRDLLTNDNKYNGFGGTGNIDQIIDNKYISLHIPSCFACETSSYSLLILNLLTAKEKFLGLAGDVNFDLNNNTATYKLLSQVEEPCNYEGPGCDNGKIKVFKPMGEDITTSLP